MEKDQYYDDNNDTKKKYKSETSGLTEKETVRLVKEEMAARYFGNPAEENIGHIAADLETDGGQKTLNKVREFLQKFRDAIREAFTGWRAKTRRRGEYHSVKEEQIRQGTVFTQKH